MDLSNLKNIDNVYRLFMKEYRYFHRSIIFAQAYYVVHVLSWLDVWFNNHDGYFGGIVGDPNKLFIFLLMCSVQSFKIFLNFC